MDSMVRRVVASPRWNGAVLRSAELVAAAVYVLIYVAFTGFGPEGQPPGQAYFPGPDWLGWLLAAGVGVPILVRRRWPSVAWAVTLTALTAATALHLTLEPWVPAGILLYAVAAHAPWPRAVGALGITLAAAAGSLVVAAVTDPVGTPASAAGLIVLVWAVTGGAWAVGAVVRERRAAAALRTREHAEQVLVGERLRIARELHDVVAHSMSLIAVQAGVANHVAATRPEETRAALRVIESTSREALTDIRRLLGVLRDPEVAYTPAPGLDALPALVAQAATGGVPATLVTTLRPGHCSDAVELVVYRIVQEALTNVVKHAAPTTCRVTVEQRGADLRVEVEDDGPQSSQTPQSSRDQQPESSGHGLAGLRERVALYGGDLTAGPRPGGGFTVVATLRPGAGA